MPCSHLTLSRVVAREQELGRREDAEPKVLDEERLEAVVGIGPGLLVGTKVAFQDDFFFFFAVVVVVLPSSVLAVPFNTTVVRQPGPLGSPLLLLPSLPSALQRPDGRHGVGAVVQHRAAKGQASLGCNERERGRE